MGTSETLMSPLSKRDCDLRGQQVLSLSLIESEDNQGWEERDMKRFSGSKKVKAVCEQVLMYSRKRG